MLYAQSAHGPRVVLGNDADGLQTGREAVWLDLFDATADEAHLAQAIIGHDLPDRGDLEEIESSSRLSTEAGAVFLSMPWLTRHEDMPVRSPFGFVLTERQMLTIRYADSPLIEAVSKRFAQRDAVPASGTDALVALLEILVDRQADALERVGALLDGMSTSLFAGHAGLRHRANSNDLRERLRDISRAGDVVSGLRDTLLGLMRIVGYVPEAARTWITPDLAQRFSILRADLNSLADYETRLQDKTQFLLDATLGFINIEQNDIFRVLTVVSVVGIPPTLIAGIYGMNFKGMPELEWTYGYWYGLAVIVLSGLLPLLWCRRRGWL